MTGSFEPYPSAPPPGGGYDAPPSAARTERPATVENAFRLMLLRCVLSLVSIIVTLADRDDIENAIRDDNSSVSQSTVDSAITIGIVSGVVILVLYALLALQVRNGRNWARIVTWVFAGLGVLGLLGTLTQATVGVERGISIVSGLIDVVLIVLLALRPSNEYFRPRGPAGY